MADKMFQDYNELIQILQNRGVTISTKEELNFAKTVLAKEGYYNLINGYSKLFLNPDSSENKYKDGTTLYEINALYQFDRILRDIFFRYILRVETHVKNLIAHCFSMKYGHSNYLLYVNFNTTGKDAQSKIMALIAEIQRQLAGHTADPSISHYLKEYGYVPLWVLNNILTMGTMSKFYSLMKTPERQCVSKTFKIMDNELENELMYLSSVRNFCAHGNRLYCYRTKNPLTNTPFHTALMIAQNDKGEFVQGKRDLFAAIIALKRLLSKNDYKRMNADLDVALKNLRKKLVILKPEDILNEMGFPNNWKNVIVLDQQANK